MVRYRRPAITFAVTGATVGAMAGGLLGTLSQSLPGVVALAWIGLGALGLGLLVELLGWPLPMMNRDTETPRAWINEGWQRWALKNGAALSVGVTTRIGFPVWYLIPAICLVGANPLVGALTWGLYGGLRTGVSVLVGVWEPAGGFGGRGSAERLLDAKGQVRHLTSAIALAIALCILVALA